MASTESSSSNISNSSNGSSNDSSRSSCSKPGSRAAATTGAGTAKSGVVTGGHAPSLSPAVSDPYSGLTVNALNNRSDLGKEPFTHTDCVAKRKRVTSPKEHSAQSQAKTACIPSLLSLPRSEEEATQENTEAKESVGLAAKADVTGIQAQGAGNTYFQGSPWKCSKGS